MNNCILCKIVKGELSSKTIFEDDLVKAVLNINPVNEGHTLILPKVHYENIFDIPKEVLERIISVSKELSIKYKKKLSAQGVNLLHASGTIAQQSIMHFHMHLVPRYKNDGLDLWFHNQAKKNIDLNKILEKINK